MQKLLTGLAVAAALALLRLRRPSLRFPRNARDGERPGRRVVAMSTVDEATAPVVITDGRRSAATECPAGADELRAGRSRFLLHVLMLRRTPASGPAFAFRPASDRARWPVRRPLL